MNIKNKTVKLSDRSRTLTVEQRQEYYSGKFQNESDFELQWEFRYYFSFDVFWRDKPAMVWNLLYLQFHFGSKCTCSLVMALPNLYLVLVANIIMLRKGKDTMAGNLSWEVTYFHFGCFLCLLSNSFVSFEKISSCLKLETSRHLLEVGIK